MRVRLAPARYVLRVRRAAVHHEKRRIERRPRRFPGPARAAVAVEPGVWDTHARMPTWHVVLNAMIGLLQLALALVVLRHLGRFGRSFPWLGALMAYFMVRGSARVYTSFYDRGEEAVQLFTDSILVGALLLLILGIRRTVAGLKLQLDLARKRESEYERALDDYHALARHRLANPLTTIVGGVATLRDMPDLDRATQREVLAGIENAARELEVISLDPGSDAPEESSLRPRPDL
jgi:signal transduction histidine kinase